MHIIIKYWKSNIIGLIFTFLAFIFFILNYIYKHQHFIEITGLLGIIAVCASFYTFVTIKANQSPNILKYWKFSARYFLQIGYSLLTGGLITLLTLPDKIISFGILGFAFYFVVIGELQNKKLEDFIEKYQTK